MTTVLRLFMACTLLAACGEVERTPVDADPSGDATVITEAALFGGAIGARVAGIDIVSSLPDNTVFATATTDASGGATIKVYPGGSVTAVYKHTVDMGAELITWVGVKPGDTLTFGSRRFLTVGHPSKVLGSVSYSWPALTGASSYRIYTSCHFDLSTTATSISASESSTCHKEPMDVVYGALDSAGKVIGVGFASNVSFMNGLTVALTSWITGKTGSVNITGLPSEVTAVSGGFAQVFDGVNIAGLSATYTNGTPTGGAYSTTFPWYPAGERTLGLVTLARSGFRSIQIADSFSVGTLSQTVAAPALPPWAQGGTTASSALRSASWVLVPGPASAHDGQLVQVVWTHKIGDVLHPSQWHFIVPPEQTSITFPTLPPLLGDHAPAAEDNMAAQTRVFELPSVTDYDMLRTLPSANLMCLECAVHSGDLQRVVFTQL